MCVCVAGGHDVQFRGLLDGPVLHPSHLADFRRGLQSVSLLPALLAHHRSNAHPVQEIPAESLISPEAIPAQVFVQTSKRF